MELARQHLRADPRSNAFARQPEYRTHVPVGAGQSQKFLPLAERAATCRRRAGGAICHPTDCPRASPPLRLSTNHRGAAPSRNADQSQACGADLPATSAAPSACSFTTSRGSLSSRSPANLECRSPTRISPLKGLSLCNSFRAQPNAFLQLSAVGAEGLEIFRGFVVTSNAPSKKQYPELAAVKRTKAVSLSGLPKRCRSLTQNCRRCPKTSLFSSTQKSSPRMKPIISVCEESTWKRTSAPSCPSQLAVTRSSSFAPSR